MIFGSNRKVNFDMLTVLNMFAESYFGYVKVKAKEYQNDHVQLNKLW